MTEGLPHLEAARISFAEGRYQEALESYRSARALKNKCIECDWGIIKSLMKMGYQNEALKQSTAVLKRKTDDKTRAQTHNLKGEASLWLSTASDVKKAREAEDEFRKAIALDGESPVQYFNLGVAILRQSRVEEGRDTLRKYLELRPDGPVAKDARNFIDQPILTRVDFAPDFRITTAEGTTLSLSELRGKVVLLDFWGTWCPPCRKAIPELRAFESQLDRERAVLISISSDSKESTWRGFLKNNSMTWPQHFEGMQGPLQSAYRVHTYPQYIVIDQQGIIRLRDVSDIPVAAVKTLLKEQQPH